MKKLFTLAAATAALAMPAMAGTMTITYTEDGGSPAPVTYDSETMMATIDGTDITFAYTWDEGGSLLCGSDIPDVGDLCVTFEGEGAVPAVGVTYPYSADNGTSGIAEITGMSE